jgi:hypothetical protein
MNATIIRDRDCPNVCLCMFHTTSAIVYRYAKNQQKPEIAFLSVKEWNENEEGRIVSGVSDFMNIFEDASLSGSVNVTAYPPPACGI